MESVCCSHSPDFSGYVIVDRLGGMYRFVPFILFISVFLISVALSPAIGPSWDEPDNIFAAGVYYKFFHEQFDPALLTIRNDQKASRYGDRIYTQNTDLERYPAFPLLVGGLAVEIGERLYGPLNGEQIISIFHVTSGLFLSVTAVFVYLLSLRFGLKKEVGVVASLVTILSPTMFGHGLSTLKDSAQVALFVTTLYFLYSYSKTKNYIFLVGGVVSWGLSLATKFNAIYIPIIWISSELFSYFSLVLQRRRIDSTLFASITKYLVLPSILLGLGGLAVMVLVWPYLWFDPVNRILEVVKYFTTVGTGYQIAWMGTTYPVGSGLDLWWYPLGSLIISTTLPVLFFFVVGVISSLVSFVQKKGKEKHYAVFLLIWICIPFLRIFSGQSAFYDGVRHFMEVFPALSFFTALGVWNVVQAAKQILPLRHLASYLYYVLSFIIVMHMIYILVALFPFTSGYINILGGRGANSNFDRDFSGLAVSEGMKYVQKVYPSANVWSPIAGHLSWYYIRPNLDLYVYTAQEADTIVFINKISHAPKRELDSLLPPGYQVVHEIKHGTNIFGWVYRKNEKI